MTPAAEERAVAPVSRDGLQWSPMRAWEHRRCAMIRDSNLRGMPDEGDLTECPAWKRAAERRRLRLKRQAAHE